jgi:hypothetical protein
VSGSFSWCADQSVTVGRHPGTPRHVEPERVQRYASGATNDTVYRDKDEEKAGWKQSDEASTRCTFVEWANIWSPKTDIL